MIKHLYFGKSVTNEQMSELGL